MYNFLVLGIIFSFSFSYDFLVLGVIFSFKFFMIF